MSEKITLYSASDSDASRHRRVAVEVALEIIKAAALGGAVNTPSLAHEFDSLSTYADSIQAALEKGNRS
jgi:hypothetical protein